MQSKRVLAVVLTAIFLLMVFPAAALAAGPDTGWYSPLGGVSEADPYLISSADELAGLSSLVNAGNDFSGKFLKIADGSVIDLSGYSNWAPIGTVAAPFRGTFDGNGIAINGLSINDTFIYPSSGVLSKLLGLFGDIGAGGTVKNVVLNDPSVIVSHTANPADYSNKVTAVGTIAGANEGIISNCTVTDAIVQVSGIIVKAGGIAGINGSDSSYTSTYVAGTITDTAISVELTASAGYQFVHAGAVAGSMTVNGSSISGCESEGSVTITAPAAGSSGSVCTGNAGGIVGYSDSALMEDSVSSCDISASDGFSNAYAGGLIGRVNRSTVTDCGSSGYVTADAGYGPTNYEETAAGGLIGLFSNNSLLRGCYSMGYVNARNAQSTGYAFAGGLVGYVKLFGPVSTIEECIAIGKAEAATLLAGYSFAGGFCGYLRGADVSSSFSSGNAEATGSSGGYAGAGGFTGYLDNATTSLTYSTGDAYANCVTKERVGGYAGVLNGSTAISQSYSTGAALSSNTGSTSFACGAFAGSANNSNAMNACYFDSTSTTLPAIGYEMVAVTGTATGLSRNQMTEADTLTTAMAAINSGGQWAKRTNPTTAKYYPELNVFYSSGNIKEAMSIASVTVPLATVALNVENGTGSGSYAAGTIVDIGANAAPSGKVFDEWVSSDGGVFANANSSNTTFTMPAWSVTVTATYKDAPPPPDDDDDDDGGPSPSPIIRVVDTPGVFLDVGEVTVEPVGDSFDQSVEVRLTEDAVAEQDIMRALSSAGVTNTSEAALVFPVDISLYILGTNTKVQPNAGTSVRITCPVPNGLLPYRDNLYVVCVVNGTLQVLNTKLTQKNGIWYVEFEATHFSPYALVADQNGVLAPGTILPADTVVNPPKTGDAHMFLWAIPLAAGAALLPRRKKR